jgi:beta-galactosidase/beta-glucuronidase
MNATTKIDIISEWGQRVTTDNVKTIFEYPRPQMVRNSTTWHSLNGLWEFEACPSYGCGPAPFGRTLNESILVPFPVESCLSGVRNHSNDLNVAPTYQRMFYRTFINGSVLHAINPSSKTLLHFGAVDWQCEIYINTLWVGSHEGGFDGFSVDITRAMEAHPQNSANIVHELIIQVFDPSNKGGQPFGKQRIEAMYAPGGDTYTPVSGIWQPVWLESVPSRYVQSLSLRANMTALDITVVTSVPDGAPVLVRVLDLDTVVTTVAG